jgi:hypothetical protein
LLDALGIETAILDGYYWGGLASGHDRRIRFKRGKGPKVSLRSIGTVRILSSDRHPVRIVTARRNEIFEFGFT